MRCDHCRLQEGQGARAEKAEIAADLEHFDLQVFDFNFVGVEVNVGRCSLAILGSHGLVSLVVVAVKAGPKAPNSWRRDRGPKEAEQAN